nr:class I SAM-dependent methyltransferase [Micromonospora sp. DSM 115978]
MTADRVSPAVRATALVAAACRADHLRRGGDRLRDEFAQPLAEAYGESLGSGRPAADAVVRALVGAGGDEVIARTRLIDDLLGQALEEAARSPEGDLPPLVVNLGAGLCVRPYRLDLGRCGLLLEIDAPDLLGVKDRVLGGHRPSCPIRRVGVDVRDGPRLAAELTALEAGRRRSVVVSEGLLPYLPPAELTALARTLADVLGDARWLADVVSVESAAGMARLAARAGADLDLYGLATPTPLEEAGWLLADYRILPVARRWPAPGTAPFAAPGPRPAPGPPPPPPTGLPDGRGTGGRGTGGRGDAGSASQRIVDGVLALDRRERETPDTD